MMPDSYDSYYDWCSYWGVCGGDQPYGYGGAGFAPGPSAASGNFFEYKTLLPVHAGENSTVSFPTANARIITVFAKNIGMQPLTVSLQNSPDAINFTDDPQQLQLTAGQTGHLVPYIFSKYTRVKANSDQPGSVFIWFQMQNDGPFQSPY